LDNTEESYVVSFMHGTSGSFISTIVWRIINEQDEGVLLTQKNSAHLESPWEQSWHHPEYGDCNTPNLFTGLSFDKIGLVKTHVYPDYDQLRSALPNTKLVLIIMDDADILEVAWNCIKKSDDENESVTVEEVQRNLTYLYEHQLGAAEYEYFWKFCDPSIVPEDLKSRVLLIKYRDIYKEQGDSFTALEQIKTFTGREASLAVLDSYRTYVTNRNKIWNK
jgi:hypothetical protein